MQQLTLEGPSFLRLTIIRHTNTHNQIYTQRARVAQRINEPKKRRHLYAPGACCICLHPNCFPTIHQRRAAALFLL